MMRSLFFAPMLAVALESDPPVQVYILLGQSNMLGMGTIKGNQDGTLEYATHHKGLYPYLLNDTAATGWSTLDHVRDVFVMGSGGPDSSTNVQHNEWMTPDPHHQATIGPELGIGYTMANYTAAPMMTLKTCIGNRALGWDLLPPGTKQWEYTDSKNVTWVYAGYHESPAKWEKGTTPKPISWIAGIQYDGDIARAKRVLADLDTYYAPSTKNYEVAGFFWWQGDRDSRDAALSDRYEYNLVRMIKQLRIEFKVPHAKFVTASLGQTVKGDTDGGGKVLDAMLAVDGTSGKYPEFAGNVAAVYTHPLSKGGQSGAHYNHNAETYMNVGEAMGAAMVELLKGDSLAITV